MDWQRIFGISNFPRFLLPHSRDNPISSVVKSLKFSSLNPVIMGYLPYQLVGRISEPSTVPPMVYLWCQAGISATSSVSADHENPEQTHESKPHLLCWVFVDASTSFLVFFSLEKSCSHLIDFWLHKTQVLQYQYVIYIYIVNLYLQSFCTYQYSDCEAGC